jgi:hypothetical protein
MSRVTEHVDETRSALRGAGRNYFDEAEIGVNEAEPTVADE